MMIRIGEMIPIIMLFKRKTIDSILPYNLMLSIIVCYYPSTARPRTTNSIRILLPYLYEIMYQTPRDSPIIVYYILTISYYIQPIL